MLLSNKRIAILAAALATLTAFVLLRRPLTADQALRRGLSCLESQDSGCLFDLANPSEMSQYGLTKPEFERLCAEYVFRGSWIREGDHVVRPTGRADTAYGSVTLLQGEKPITFYLLAMKLNEGGRLVGLITYLIMTRMPPQDKNIGDGIEQRIAWVERDKATLEALGIHGIYRGPGEAFMSWAEWEAHYRKRLPKVAEESLQ